jgi:hypothetical protein
MMGLLLASCLRAQFNPHPIVGDWMALTTTTRSEGRPEEIKRHEPNQLTIAFAMNGSFQIVDRSGKEPIKVWGDFDLAEGNIIRESITEVEGGKPLTDRLVGTKSETEFSITGNRLTLVNKIAGPDGKPMSRTESVFVRLIP